MCPIEVVRWILGAAVGEDVTDEHIEACGAFGRESEAKGYATELNEANTTSIRSHLFLSPPPETPIDRGQSVDITVAANDNAH